MEKVRPWCGQLLDRGWLRNRTEHTSVTVGVASSVANDVSENDVTMTAAGLWRYGDWRHVAMGCTALVFFTKQVEQQFSFKCLHTYSQHLLDDSRGSGCHCIYDSCLTRMFVFEERKL